MRQIVLIFLTSAMVNALFAWSASAAQDAQSHGEPYGTDLCPPFLGAGMVGSVVGFGTGYLLYRAGLAGWRQALIGLAASVSGLCVLIVGNFARNAAVGSSLMHICGVTALFTAAGLGLALRR